MKRTTFTKKLCAPIVFSALAVSSVHAQESIIQGWSGTATLGATSLSGNTEANSINAGIRLGKTVGKWEHLVFGSVFDGDATSERDAVDENGELITFTDAGGNEIQVTEQVSAGNSERYALGYQPRYYWRPRTYFFGLLDFERDRPANIDLSTRQLIGIGHKFYANASGFFSAEIGVGNSLTELVLGDPETGDDEISGGTAYLGANYLNRITDNLTFNADLRADIGSDNNYYQLNLGLAFKLSETLALKVAHETRGNSDITNPTQLDPSDNDSATTINLVVDI